MECNQINKQEAHQMVELSKMLRHSTLKYRQTFSQIQCVIIGDLASNRDQTMRIRASRTRFTHFCAVHNHILQSTGNS